MVKAGFIKLYRSLLEWEWFSDEKVLKVFIYLLLSANIDDLEWQGVKVPRGSLVTSYSNLAKECGFSVKQIRGILDKLISTGEVTRQTTSKFSVITLNNYDRYQSAGKQKGRQRASNWAAKGQQNKNIKKEEEKEGACAHCPSDIFEEPEWKARGFESEEAYLNYLRE